MEKIRLFTSKVSKMDFRSGLKQVQKFGLEDKQEEEVNHKRFAVSRLTAIFAFTDCEARMVKIRSGYFLEKHLIRNHILANHIQNLRQKITELEIMIMLRQHLKLKNQQ